MTRRRGTASLVASPVLVGAVTVLISIIAVFIAYNANAGLPFVPTYDLKAEIPSGAKLVKGNEVRTGGFRVGVVEDITPKVVETDGRRRSIAVLDMKLDKKIEPLPADTTFYVRPRSALGLKYVELTPGGSRRTLTAGSTVPLSRAPKEALELETIYSLFDDDTRDNARAATEGFGDAFAGRGRSLNTAIEALNPLFRSLVPVMSTLADPDTDLDNFFRQLGGAAAQVAPVADVQAQLFTNMADTFAAIGANPAALQATIEKSPSTEDVAISSFRVQQPFLADFADLSRRLRPAAAEIPRSMPAINDAFEVGTPILPRTVPLNEQLQQVLERLDETFENPNTLLALRDLNTAITVTAPAVEFIAPYQTVCGYSVYWFNGLGEHMSFTTTGGTAQNQNLKFANLEQPNTFANPINGRPWDIPTGGAATSFPWSAPDGPYGASYAGEPAGRLFSTPYLVSIDAQGNADCQLGQVGFPRGPLHAVNTRYGPGNVGGGNPITDPVTGSGGNYTITSNNFPNLHGPTYMTGPLGINSLQDVERVLDAGQGAGG
jgi:virulence factor Mce-like protein